MPRRDGTGPSGTTRGTGYGRQSNQQTQDYCVCPKCGTRIAHTRGTPCNAMKCPKCSTLMTRD